MVDSIEWPKTIPAQPIANNAGSIAAAMNNTRKRAPETAPQMTLAMMIPLMHPFPILAMAFSVTDMR